MIVRVLTTCHTQYTWDSSICIFLFNRTTLQVFVTYLTGALYVHPLWFYKHQHDNWVHSTQNAFSLPFAAILVNCAPSREMHNYCTPRILLVNENFENFLIHRCDYILLSQVYCVWQVVKTLTTILITLYIGKIYIYIYIYIFTYIFCDYIQNIYVKYIHICIYFTYIFCDSIQHNGDVAPECYKRQSRLHP